MIHLLQPYHVSVPSSCPFRKTNSVPRWGQIACQMYSAMACFPKGLSTDLRPFVNRYNQCVSHLSYCFSLAEAHRITDTRAVSVVIQTDFSCIGIGVLQGQIWWDIAVITRDCSLLIKESEKISKGMTQMRNISCGACYLSVTRSCKIGINKRLIKRTAFCEFHHTLIHEKLICIY